MVFFHQSKLYITILFLLLVTSCEKEIGEFTEQEAPRLVVNALITAQQENQLMAISTTYLKQATPLPGADVTLSVNGQTILQYRTTGEGRYIAVPTEQFNPGDVVSVHVQKDDMVASASSTVPFPVAITGIDTLMVKAKRYKWSSDYSWHTRYLLHLRLADNIADNEACYFRAEVHKRMIYPHSVHYSPEGVLSQVTYTEDDDHTFFGYWNDPALTETENADQENMSVSFDWLDGIENVYHTFRSSYFKDREYTLHLDLTHPHLAASFTDRWGWAQDVTIRIYAISRTEYNYLQALAALKTLDTGTIYDSEPGVTTNVEGGAGIFCVESVSEVSFYEDHDLIRMPSAE